MDCYPCVLPISAPPEIGEYWPGQGGIYAGIMPDWSGGTSPQHLIFSVHEGTDLQWGGYLASEPHARSPYDGALNTNALVRSTYAHPAATWADKYQKDGHADFHLPSRRELDVGYATIEEQFSASHWYWSSTEESATAAQGRNATQTGLDSLFKTFPGRVRAVRTVPAGATDH
ncbi:hypothetical protein WKR88_20730 [Trinickia caryophylli]|uniref:DUF1566 domain-containing protein n=1 Tax=Trinickia caryophylli TaxID=28094 RepID=A0A1X7F2T2_TRICW|nr:hypothetical protein [Trinickia caryophylli]PMS10360.1 DUF1566 domain-containing protein [Trinickia caryophylli]TRX19517.1 DUF1566 domain-containing protein [Trinickia caryophylli]WQE13173.1 hypothetical protein U0034_07245 [Trinickia caryophylli]SMF44348.1 hypothetical protein SAMN06295900_10743 [Trinickia caryophylli]GLU34523.1 hypothetical protein Busp01_43650 [Trinickia caryophylli]